MGTEAGARTGSGRPGRATASQRHRSHLPCCNHTVREVSRPPLGITLPVLHSHLLCARRSQLVLLGTQCRLLGLLQLLQLSLHHGMRGVLELLCSGGVLWVSPGLMGQGAACGWCILYVYRNCSVPYIMLYTILFIKMAMIVPPLHVPCVRAAPGACAPPLPGGWVVGL